MVTPKSAPQRNLGVYGCYPIHRLPGKKSRSPGGQVAVSQHCNFKGPSAAWMGEILMLHLLPSISISSLLIIQGKDFSSRGTAPWGFVTSCRPGSPA